jgi:formamidopyrimidine-DNA glycosylase
MPELPEVETTRRGIAAHVTGHRIRTVVVRNPRLRWPVPKDLADRLTGQTIRAVRRRGKYLLLDLGSGCVIVHLGMSGSLRIVRSDDAPRRHDHVDIVLDDGHALRLHDPRRFGAVLWSNRPGSHPLLRSLGPEPWEATAEYLYRRSRRRRQAIKSYIMDSRTIVGVGNIYASESLFEAGIRPRRAAGRVSLQEYARLAAAIVKVLERSIRLGGTTLRDFVSATGEPGYFRQTLQVYERQGQRCRACGTPIKRLVMVGRASYYCPHCQR